MCQSSRTNFSQFAGNSDLGWLTNGTGAGVEAVRAARSSTPPGTVEELDALDLIDAARDEELYELHRGPRERQHALRGHWKPRERHLRGW